MKYYITSRWKVLRVFILVLMVSSMVWITFNFMGISFKPSKPIIVSNYTFGDAGGGFNRTYIKRMISIINEKQKIYNEDLFGSVKNDTLVIVVQVHNRLTYLKYLVSSIRAAPGSSELLLIFSHDYYDEEINTFIHSIDFCKVMQIFYPHSTQLYPDKFPGPDPNDCPPDTPEEEAIQRSCPNAFFIDVRKKYRNPKLSQVKHHWWWKTNRVFTLQTMRNHSGLVLFPDDDLFFVEDFIPTLKLMQSTGKESCDKCKIFSLAGNTEAIYPEKAEYDKIDEAIITTMFNNMGFAFTRSTWNEVLDCVNDFCFFDDYNYDYALQHVFTTCMKDAVAMTLTAPRVIHLGNCGMHFTDRDCDPAENILTIHEILTKHQEFLYPKKLKLVDKIDNIRFELPTGGFADLRDQAFCLGMTVR